MPRLSFSLRSLLVEAGVKKPVTATYNIKSHVKSNDHYARELIYQSDHRSWQHQINLEAMRSTIDIGIGRHSHSQCSRAVSAGQPTMHGEAPKARGSRQTFAA